MNVSVSIYATPKRAFLCHASDDETTLIIKNAQQKTILACLKLGKSMFSPAEKIAASSAGAVRVNSMSGSNEEAQLVRRLP